ncbi:GGDEF domain-containing protein [Marinimicrobium sp. LS-A18]|uniref:GGDEF domain-containing protein n=1 Tax=Marinimicrobium sp. LS-A18 TaxID=1381596 RepID=UPI000463446F|nr:GGDEF domain-containing protein [Marinimicrobium sp. LS-A18]
MPDDARPLHRQQPRTPQKDAAEQRLRLLQRLMTTQEPGTMVTRFYDGVAPLLSLKGLRYEAPVPGGIVDIGNTGRHQCDYALHGSGQPLGSLLFYRDRRFSELELARLEEWLSLLVVPLSNALNYQNAVRLASVDALTGLGNRAALDTALHRELRLAERCGSEFSLLLVDVDHFKQINDRWGHSRGDQVLREVGKAISHACRETDLVYRYGGEEFVVLLSGTDANGARIFAERLRHAVQTWVSDRERLSVTVSIGVSTRKPEGETSIHSLFDRADQALYRAKAQGRNRVAMELTCHTGEAPCIQAGLS